MNDATHVVRLAAAGDVHCEEARRRELTAAVGALRGAADLVLVAGDITNHGDPAEAHVLVGACRGLDVPVLAVLGNHDHHRGGHAEIAGILREGGIRVLERDTAVHEVGGVRVGVVGLKGFVGGFGDSQLPDFGEALLRAAYAETTADVDALDAGLRAVADCDARVVLLHYAPVSDTLAGERSQIWPFLGSERLAGPIAEHRPDLVLHGHAHAGTFAGAVGPVPVRNVAVPVMGRPFTLFELGPGAVAATGGRASTGPSRPPRAPADPR